MGFLSWVSSQIPRCITITKSQWTFLMPVEIAGWVLKQVKVEQGDWVLAVGDDVRMAVSLLMRGPVPLNVTLGVLSIGDRENAQVQKLIEPIKGAVRHQHSLRHFSWEERRACFEGHTLRFYAAFSVDGILIAVCLAAYLRKVGIPLPLVHQFQ